MQHLETASAGSPGVKMDDELIDDSLQQRQIPAASADTFELGVGQSLPAQAETIAARLPFLFEPAVCWPDPGARTALQPIGVIAARVGPEHDRRRGMITLAADDDLVSRRSTLWPILGCCPIASP